MTDKPQTPDSTIAHSDRIRYYWTDELVHSALQRLLHSLGSQSIPESLVSQAFSGLEFGEIQTDPNTLIEHHVLRSVRRYYSAAGQDADDGSTFAPLFDSS